MAGARSSGAKSTELRAVNEDQALPFLEAHPLADNEPRIDDGSEALPPSRNPLVDLPPELIDNILAYLSPLQLTRLSGVCRVLYEHATGDVHWQRHVLANLPAHRITSPYPCKTWRDLYVAHDPYWFLTKYKIWFGDREMTGQIILVRYDERRGCLEGYQLLAVRSQDSSEIWSANPNVHIQHFEPHIRLHLDQPTLQLDVRTQPVDHLSQTPTHLLSELPMHIRSGLEWGSSFLLARPLDAMTLPLPDATFPYDCIWPPPAVRAQQRVKGKPLGIRGGMGFRGSFANVTMQKPRSRFEISDHTFRLRQRMQMGREMLGVHVNEEIVTYSTLDPALYKPTAEKPWRGIWCGDYSGHGCEFILIDQPDEDGDARTMPLQREPGETDEQYHARFLSERVYKGRLEAIKLTGDPNVPRGEPTFIADDLGEAGFVGHAPEPFEGARVVQSRGLVAAQGFYGAKFINTQLLLLSHDRLAQHWIAFDHISFFQRVNIDKFLVPE